MKYLILFFSLLPTLLLASSRAAGAAPSTAVLITAIYMNPYDSRASSDGARAVQFQNVSAEPVSMAGWQLGNATEGAFFPTGAEILPGHKIWVSKLAAAFHQDFGFNPDFEYGGDSDPTVPNLTGAPPAFNTDGDVVLLKNAQGELVDGVPYGLGAATSGWVGPAVSPYRIGSRSVLGQVLYRKMRERDGLPLPDTDTASDWAQDTADRVLGKRAMYPGWDTDEFFQTARGTDAQVTVKYCVAPDNLFECYRDEILSAKQSIQIEAYSLDNAAIVDALTQTLQSGVTVRALLDRGALSEQGKWACMQIETWGGQCWLMDSKPWNSIYARYESLHAKWTIVDGTRLLAGSENMGDDAMPGDDKSDGTLGTRGGYLITDSPTLVARAQAVLNRDLDPAQHADVRRWGDAGDWPAPDFKPNYANGGTGYPVQFPAPFSATGTFAVELVQCPDNCLRESDALLGLVHRAGAGDTLLVEQLYEYTYWGSGSSNRLDDPNLRLEAYLDAARRGARVQILLDSFYDSFSDPRGNYATCLYVNSFSPALRVECRLGNPTGRGIHNKMVLLKQGDTGFVHLGSINGSESSSKLNRELAAQVESRAAYDYWAAVFAYDWSVSPLSPHALRLPLLLR